MCYPDRPCDASDLDWVAKPPHPGETRAPPTYEKDLVAGDGAILGKGAFGVTRLSKSSFTGKYYAVRALVQIYCMINVFLPLHISVMCTRYIVVL